jgi:hypothetical protein
MASHKNKLLKDRAPFDTEQALILAALALAGTSTEKREPWLFQPLEFYPENPAGTNYQAFYKFLPQALPKMPSAPTHVALTYWLPDPHRYW